MGVQENTPVTGLSVALVGDKEMRPLNAKYRKKNQTTDVLSFFVADQPKASPIILGDVIISVEKARQQAKERGRSRDEELVTLLIHGIVHLLGYDHERSAQDARAMKRLENKIYRKLCDQGLLKV